MKEDIFIQRLINIGYPANKAGDLYRLYSDMDKLSDLESYLTAKEESKQLDAIMYKEVLE